MGVAAMSWMHVEDTKPKARKRHVCLLCGFGIEVGEVYVRRFGFGDEGPCSFEMHVRCERLTAEWRWEDADWEDHDVGEFRVAMAAMDAAALTDGKEQA